MDCTGEAAVDDITTLLHRCGSADDGGERVTQRACALQTAGQAEQQDDADFSVVRFRSDFVLASEEHPALHKKSGQKYDPRVNKDFLASFWLSLETRKSRFGQKEHRYGTLFVQSQEHPMKVHTNQWI